MMNTIISTTKSVEGYCDFMYGREGYKYTIEDKRINFSYLHNESEVRIPIRFNVRI